MYKAPPIVEAVLQFQLTDPVPMAALERVKSKLVDRLPNVTVEQIYNVDLNVEAGKATVTSDASGLRLWGSGSSNEQVHLTGQAVTSIVQSPYPGWDKFQDLAQTAWGSFSDIAKPRGEISRIGLRYINRIDVPTGGKTFKIEDYLKFYYEAPQPPLFPSFGFEVKMLTRVEEDENILVSLASRMTESPLFDHAGIILDIDVFTTNSTPLEGEALWEVVQKMRSHKNIAFEACITDRTRDLISYA